MIRVMSVFGTRPEAIKMCPLVKAMEQEKEIESIVCLTGQHREMLTQVVESFGIMVHYNLDIMRPGQTLTTITTSILQRLQRVFREVKPDIVFIHGDTSTAFAAALAAFYQKIPVGHVEAGLRTCDKYSPYPEEMNRCLIARIADLHFAPTENNRKNLEAEHITKGVYVTGNTVIDAFSTTVKNKYKYINEDLRNIDFNGKRCILMTAHRRENLGRPLEQICRAAADIVDAFADVELIYPLHMNPAVRETAEKILGKQKRVHLIEPLDVTDMHNLMAASFLVMTDSGGIQEEAPAFGVPVLVLRTETERPEAAEAGTVKVVGVEEADIYAAAKRLLSDPAEYEKMAHAINPYGDGHASARIIDLLLQYFSIPK